MQQDSPFSPNLGRYPPPPSTANVPPEPPEPPEPFEADAPTGLYTRSETPTWPGANERVPRGFAHGRVPGGSVSSTLFGVSLGANVVLVVAVLGLLGALFLSHAGGAGGQASTSGSAHGATLGSASATPTVSPASSLTPHGGWLQVTPSSVQLGCSDSQRSQVVLLQNNGPETVQWQVELSGPAYQAGVSVTPHRGSLAAGTSQPIQIQNTTHGSDQGGSGQQGVIAFTLTSLDAGSSTNPSTNLTYTTTSCG